MGIDVKLFSNRLMGDRKDFFGLNLIIGLFLIMW